MKRCGQTFARAADGAEVICVREAGHACSHIWGDDLTKSRAKPITSAAARHRRKPRVAKEADVTPQVETKLPAGYTLAHRPTRDPRADERPVLLDEQRRVRAVIEVWRPN